MNPSRSDWEKLRTEIEAAKLEYLEATEVARRRFAETIHRIEARLPDVYNSYGAKFQQTLTARTEAEADYVMTLDDEAVEHAQKTTWRAGRYAGP